MSGLFFSFFTFFFFSPTSGRGAYTQHFSENAFFCSTARNICSPHRPDGQNRPFNPSATKKNGKKKLSNVADRSFSLLFGKRNAFFALNPKRFRGGKRQFVLNKGKIVLNKGKSGRAWSKKPVFGPKKKCEKTRFLALFWSETANYTLKFRPKKVPKMAIFGRFWPFFGFFRTFFDRKSQKSRFFALFLAPTRCFSPQNSEKVENGPLYSRTVYSPHRPKTQKRPFFGLFSIFLGHSMGNKGKF